MTEAVSGDSFIGFSKRQWYDGRGGLRLEPLEIAHKIVEAATEKQASNIVLLDTRDVCSFADYFVICSAESERQIEAIADEIERALRKEAVPPRQLEGTPDSGWVLLDYGGVVAHIFAASEREYYNLDELWCHASPLVRIE